LGTHELIGHNVDASIYTRHAMLEQDIGLNSPMQRVCF